MVLGSSYGTVTVVVGRHEGVEVAIVVTVFATTILTPQGGVIRVGKFVGIVMVVVGMHVEIDDELI